MVVRRNFSRESVVDIFAYPFQVSDDVTQMDVHKMLYPFYTTKKMPNVLATVVIANSDPSKKIPH